MTLTKIIRNIKRGDKLIITPQLDSWLATKGDTLGLTDEASYHRLLELFGASKVNNERAGHFGGSARGTCLRRQVFAFLGLPVARIREPELQMIFNDGTFRHIRWQLMLMAAGVVTDVEVRVVVPDWRLETSIDALNDDDEWLFELKGSRRMPLSAERIPVDHKLQMHTYMFATGWDMCLYVVEDKASQQWVEFVVRRDDTYIQAVQSELTILNKYIDRQTFPPVLNECKKRKGVYTKCPYAAWCLEAHREGVEWADPGQWPWEASAVSTGLQVGRRQHHCRTA